MNARVKASSIATNKQKRLVLELVQEEMQRQSEASMRRLFKLFCFCLNAQERFGKVRLSRLIANVSELATLHEHDEIFWTHIDKRMEQIGIEFEKEDYKELEK